MGCRQCLGRRSTENDLVAVTTKQHGNGLSYVLLVVGDEDGRFCWYRAHDVAVFIVQTGCHFRWSYGAVTVWTPDNPESYGSPTNVNPCPILDTSGRAFVFVKRTSATLYKGMPLWSMARFPNQLGPRVESMFVPSSRALLWRSGTAASSQELILTARVRLYHT